MNQSDKATLKGIAMIPVAVLAAGLLVTAPMLITGANKDRDNIPGFLLALSAGIGLSFFGMTALAPHIDKVSGPPAPFEAAPRAPKWRPLNSKGKPIYFR